MTDAKFDLYQIEGMEKWNLYLWGTVFGERRKWGITLNRDELISLKLLLESAILQSSPTTVRKEE